MDIQEFLENGDRYYLPNLSIDIVVIGYEENALKCLLLKIGKRWVLPGGYVQRDESVEIAAMRILKERTTLDRGHLNFLSVFGDKDRSFGEQFRRFASDKDIPWSDDYWVNSRFVTLSHYSLVNIRETFPGAGSYDEEIAWFGFDELPDMWLDHGMIVTEAHKKMKEDIKGGQTVHQLLPDKFTMPELHELHQCILEEELDRSRFQKKMLASGKFERLPKLHKGTPGRKPFLYRVFPS